MIDKAISAYLKAPFMVELREEKLPAPGPDEVVLKIRACGVCGSDVNESYTRQEFSPFGHEFAADVLEVGSQVTNIKVGDKVMAESSSFCGKCAACRNGHVEMCTNRFIFHNPYNGFSDYTIAKAAALVPFDGISYEEAAVIEPMGVALDLVNVTDIQLGDHVVVFGAGPIGIMAIRLAKLRGAAKVTLVARSHSVARIEAAKRNGADEVVYTDKTQIKEAFKGVTVNKVMVTTPPPTIADAIDICSFGAIVGAIGFGRSREEVMVPIDTNKMHFRRLQLRFSFAAPALFFPQCAELIKAGLIDVKSLISHRFKLSEMQQAMNTARDDKAGTVKIMMIND